MEFGVRSLEFRVGLDFCLTILQNIDILLLGNSSVTGSTQCNRDVLPPDKKLFYHEGDKVDINLLSSGTTESRYQGSVKKNIYHTLSIVLG